MKIIQFWFFIVLLCFLSCLSKGEVTVGVMEIIWPMEFNGTTSYPILESTTTCTASVKTPSQTIEETQEGVVYVEARAALDPAGNTPPAASTQGSGVFRWSFDNNLGIDKAIILSADSADCIAQGEFSSKAVFSCTPSSSNTSPEISFNISLPYFVYYEITSSTHDFIDTNYYRVQSQYLVEVYNNQGFYDSWELLFDTETLTPAYLGTEIQYCYNEYFICQSLIPNAPFNFAVSTQTVATLQIPEPATLSLFALGGLVSLRKRK